MRAGAGGSGLRKASGEARAFAAVCAGSLLLSGWSIWRARFKLGSYTAWVLYDDAMISMRYARNLAHGDGLVWNAGGEKVEGITNPLWALWMAVLHLLPVGPFKQPLLVMLSSALLLLAALWVARRLAHELAPGQPTVAIAAAVVTATFSPLVLWAMGGMEVGLLAWLLGAAVLAAVRLVARPEAWQRRDTIVAAALAVAAIATRVDAVVGLAAIAAAAVWCAAPAQRRRVALVLGGPTVGGLALVTAARLAYYGELLPNTYYLKATGVALDVRLEAGLRHLTIAMWAHLAVLVVAAVFGALGARARPQPARGADAAGDMGETGHTGDDEPAVPVPAGAATSVGAAANVRPPAEVAEAADVEEPEAGEGSGPRLVPILVSLGVVQVLYSVWVGGDAWESLLIANRYLSVAIVPVAVLAALGVARLAAEPRAFGRFCLLVAAILGAGVLVARSSFGEGGVTTYSRKILGIEAHDQSVVYLLLVLVLVAGGLVVGRGVVKVSPAVLATVAVLLVVVLTNARPATSWVHHPAFDLEQGLARRGWALRQSTSPDAEVAVWLAGAEPYFADRPAVDLFGKSDKRIARLPVRKGLLFWPGHDKYDLAGSIEEWDPDLVMLGGSSPNGPEIVEILEDHGYAPMSGGVWQRETSDLIDRWELAGLLDELREETADN